MINDIMHRRELVRVIGVTPMTLKDHWPLAWPHIEEALRRCGYVASEANVLEDIKAGNRQLWSVDGKAYALSKITLDEERNWKILNIQALGGSEMELWLHDLVAFFELLAVNQKCNEIISTGRFGWKRVATTYGYEPVAMVARKLI